MNLNLNEFRKFIESIVKPRWDNQDEEWHFRPGGGESYIQDKVLNKASSHLTEESLQSDIKLNLIKALKSHYNLLSPFESSFAKKFIEVNDEGILKEKLLFLLYNTETPLKQRLMNLLEWAKVQELSEGGKKSGINATVCSYFLAMTDPKEYPYCKPIAYNALVDYFLSNNERQTDQVERILHCQIFYKELLRILEKEYGLINGNLLDVHSLGYFLSSVKSDHKSTRYWTYSPGRDAKFWENHFNDGIMTIGWDFIGDLRQFNDKETLRSKMQSRNDDNSSHKNSVLACYDFAYTIKPGDFIFAKKGKSQLLGYGIVQSDYFFDDNRNEHKNVREVNWIKKGVWDTSKNQLALKTLTDITSFPDFVEHLKRLVDIEDSKPSGESNYWWLNANPKIWNFTDSPIGESHIYTAYNDKGNKRRIFKYFESIKPDDIILGYVASPNCEIAAECRVTKGLHDSEEGTGFEFEKREQFFETVSLEELKKIPELNDCEPLKNNQGSLFKLTETEYETIRIMIDERNVKIDAQPYSIESALKTLFIAENKFRNIIDRIKHKKNMVLQGPPGVGKTYIARHLAYALIGVIDKRRVVMTQFHQSYSYEDFIQGFRPNNEGKFEIKNGVFYDFCRKAQRDSANKYVFIIDEINRGNLSKILGEMFMLVEVDKRGPDFAMPLTYAQNSDDKFFIPENVYIIGTMNTADRSLAMVDYALRRRFCFINLDPAFENEKFRKYLLNLGVENATVDKVIDRMVQLNLRIAEDHKNLGRGYCVGHSYFCPTVNQKSYDGAWYENVIRTEIEPLLEEYWFDDPDKVNKRVDLLLS